MTPEISESKAEQLEYKIKQLQQSLDLKDFERQKKRYTNEVIIFGSGLFTILSFLFNGLFIWLNVLFLLKLIDYNHRNKDHLIDSQVKTLVSTTLLVAVPFFAAKYSMPEIITLGEYIKTVIL